MRLKMNLEQLWTGYEGGKDSAEKLSKIKICTIKYLGSAINIFAYLKNVESCSKAK